MQKKSSGFTLIEILIVIGIIALISGVALVAINPARQFANARNTQRSVNVAEILKSLDQYAASSFTGYPPGIDNYWRVIGTATTGCSLTCAPVTVTPQTTYTDATIATFNAGTHNNTQATNPGAPIALDNVGLTSVGLSAGSATYTSSIKDVGQPQTWTTIQWTPWIPYGKEILNNWTGNTENGYAKGGLYMWGTTMLLHMNEASGLIMDSSGNGHHGTITGGVAYNTPAKLGTGLTFNGTNGYVSMPNDSGVPSAPNPYVSLSWNYGTIAFWMKPTFNLGADTGMGIIRMPDYGANLNFPGGYNVEIYRATASGPTTIKGSLGWGNGTTSNVKTLLGTTPLVSGNWYHVIMTYNLTTLYLYLNGVLEASMPYSNSTLWSSQTAPLFIGRDIASESTNKRWYSGVLDEIVLFNGRTMTSDEALGLYARGAAHLKLQVRTCDDPACSGENFTGPAGTTSDYYTDASTGSQPPTYTITNQPVNRYFQYKALFDTEAAQVNPTVRSVIATNNYVAANDPNVSATACLNLGASLAPTYLPSIPFDPQNGSLTKTYYAVKKTGTDTVSVRACTPELSKTIEAAH